MDKKESEYNFLELLRLNDKEKIKKYVFENGKEGKTFCPISFMRGEENDKKEE